MAPSGPGAPSAHETQLFCKALVGTDPACSTAEVNTIANPSIEDDTPSADENMGMSNINMDGNPSDEDESSSEQDIDADDLESDGNSSADAATESSADDPLDDETLRLALRQMKNIISENEELKRKAEEDSHTINNLRHDADHHASSAKRLKTRCDGLENDKLRLTVDLKQKADRDVIKASLDAIKEANEHLRHELDEKKAELQRGLGEKAGYHDIKKERTEFHSQLIKKTDNCKELEKKNEKLQHELVEMTINCTALKNEVAELQRKFDLEKSFSAQAMAMFSKDPEI